MRASLPCDPLRFSPRPPIHAGPPAPPHMITTTTTHRAPFAVCGQLWPGCEQARVLRHVLGGLHRGCCHVPLLHSRSLSPLSVVSPGQLSSLTQLVTSLLSVVSPGRLSSLTRLVFTPLLMFVFLFLHRDCGRGWVWYLGYWAVLRRLPGLGTCCGIPLSTRCAHLLAGITTWRSHTSRLHTLAHGQITLCSSMLGSCSVLVGVGRRCCGSAVRGAGCAGCGNLYTGLCCGTCPALLGAAVYLRVPTPPVLFATKNTPHGSLRIFPRCTTCSGC